MSVVWDWSVVVLRARVIVCAGAPVFWFGLHLTDPALLCQGFAWRRLGIGHNGRLVQSVSML